MTDINGNTKYLEFIEKDKPFDAGDYIVNVEHHIPTVGSEAPGRIEATSFKFTVAAPRFTLNPQDVISVFPPPGSLGDHSNVLPHIQFQRSTLPWERTPGDGAGPWLALLVLHEGESDKPSDPPNSDPNKPRPWTLGDLQSSSSGTNGIWWTGITPETNLGQDTGDPVNIIEVDAGLLEPIFRNPEIRNLLAHIRNNTDTEKTPSGKERAVIIANRLPMAGGSSVVHLVSLEGQNVKTETTSAKIGDKVRLISLYNWRFSCTKSELSFTGLLKNLNRNLLLQVSLPSSDQPSLDSNKIPDTLKTAFTQIGKSLTNSAQLTSVKPDEHWRIQDGSHQFDLTLEPRPNVFTVEGFLHPKKELPGLQISDIPKGPLGRLAPNGTLWMELQKNGFTVSPGAQVVTMTEGSYWQIQDSVKGKPITYDLKFGPRLQTRAGRVVEQMPGVLRLPRTANADAESYFARGALGLPHRTRYANRTISWYHGPFAPGAFSSPQFNFPNQAAEQLLLFDSSIDMWDVSYAAAWELGRLLTLQNKPVAAALYDWKRQHAQALKLQAAEQLLMHLPLGQIKAPDDLPPNVISWFQELSRLRGIPFRYLIPDERMLPPESLRFFQIDSQWIACLLDGAFSVGRVLGSDDAVSKHFNPTAFQSDAKSGLLLRSAVVSGYPDLKVDGSAKVREQKLSDNLLLCLFSELVTTVNIHLKPEALHFGLERSGSLVQRTLRKSTGELDTSTISIKFLDPGNSVVDWKDLKTQIEAKLSGWNFSEDGPSSAVIAFQMIAEVEQVKFTVG